MEALLTNSAVFTHLCYWITPSLDLQEYLPRRIATGEIGIVITISSIATTRIRRVTPA